MVANIEAVMTSVRDSHLNFSIQETPFSIYLTLRKPFAKNNQSHLLKPNQPRQQIHVESEQIREKVKMLEKKLKDEELKSCRFEELYKQEKMKVKEAAVIKGQFRAELLNIKSEKKIIKFRFEIFTRET